MEETKKISSNKKEKEILDWVETSFMQKEKLIPRQNSGNKNIKNLNIYNNDN